MDSGSCSGAGAGLPIGKGTALTAFLPLEAVFSILIWSDLAGLDLLDNRSGDLLCRPDKLDFWGLTFRQIMVYYLQKGEKQDPLWASCLGMIFSSLSTCVIPSFVFKAVAFCNLVKLARLCL